MKIALAQINILWENKEKNKLTCSNYIAKAKKEGCRMIIFPEMTLTGFSMNTKNINETSKNSSTLEFFINEARKNEIFIVFGYIESIDANSFNKCITINSSGEIINAYDKIHLFSIAGENNHIQKGKKLSYFDCDNITFSPFICYDLRFPEIFQIASLHSKALIIIANWPSERIYQWETLIKARAIETQSYILAANRVGEGNNINYNGHSIIADPNGNILNKLSEKEELIIHDIDFNIVSNVRNNFNYKKDRRDSLYEFLHKEEVMKSSDEQIKNRGFITNDEIIKYENYSPVECLKLLESEKAFERSIAARLLANGTIDKDLANFLCTRLSKEDKLYTKIELCNTLRKSGCEGAKVMINYLGKIGTNQYKELPDKLFNKNSYPLPRDIIARTLAHMDSDILPILIDSLKSCDIIAARELIDAIGFMCFYTNCESKTIAFKALLIYLEENNEDKLIRWKVVRALSSFNNSIVVDTLLAIKDSDEEDAIINEANRSLNIIKLRNENSFIKNKIDITKIDNKKIVESN